MMGKISHSGTYKNVNKPAFKYNDLQHADTGRETERERERNSKPAWINMTLVICETYQPKLVLAGSS